MTTPTKTPWFDSTDPPSRTGDYEGDRGLLHRVEWDGIGWFVYGVGTRLPILAPFKWRGLLCCHKTVTKRCDWCPHGGGDE